MLLELDWIAAAGGDADLAIFHEFALPPSGGGNQFLVALSLELGRQGLSVERNRISWRTHACLFNSFNFDAVRLNRFSRKDVRMVHRVDGPVGVYRGFDDGTDDHIASVNRFANATIFQSQYSFAKHRELGYELVEPHVIVNAVDPRIFHSQGRARFSRDRPVRIAASSWSDNPRKGGPTYRWLADRLDPERFTFTFVGRTKEPFPNVVEPLPSDRLADLLRANDVFLTASENEACSNAVLEALACGLPVVYLRSGGTPELVGDAGLAFDDREELPALLERIVDEYETRQARIISPRIADVAERYREVLGIDAR